MITLNTNGWFVDETVAERLAASGARVHVSIDGVSAELHDASRGVTGSWRRAVNAIDLLLSRGARVQVVHVVTPQNRRPSATCSSRCGSSVRPRCGSLRWAR